MKKRVTSGGYQELFRRSQDGLARLLTMGMVTAILVYIFYNIVFG